MVSPPRVEPYLPRTRLLGNQDTVYTRSKQRTGTGSTRACTPARQYFSDSYIEGNVDFIFGDGKTVFDHCEIHSTPHPQGFITAQSKKLMHNRIPATSFGNAS
jgi:pectin methylesterase-like acyl-CoA thioesterase